MASMSVSCHKCPVVTRSGASGRTFFLSTARPSLFAGSSHQRGIQRKIRILKVQAHEAIVGSSNSSNAATTMSEAQPLKGDNLKEEVDEFTVQIAVSDSKISAVMREISNLVKLVDSKDITELQLKQRSFELIIRKSEALPLPTPAPPVVMMQSPLAMFPSQPPPTDPPPAPSTPSPALPSPPSPALPPQGSKPSSLPPLKCPMAGTFYRCPAPGEPPFVKVGDKVKKGQVVCIIEAMKLMNEIEADQSGTVVEILAEDGKPVSVDTPLLIIEP